MNLRFRQSNKGAPSTDDSAPTPEVPDHARVSFWREAASVLLVLVAAVLIAYFTKLFIIQPYIVEGASMETTLQDHDRLLVNKLPTTFARLSGHPYVPKRGDIIIFNQSNLPGYIGSKQLVKRVIGLPGDRVVIKDGKITIYNSANPKGFNPDTTVGYKLSSKNTSGSTDLILGAQEIFVCGDNRDNSEDSRFFGPVKLNQVVGKLTLRIFPVNKISHY